MTHNEGMSSFDEFYAELLDEAADKGPRSVSEVYALGAVYTAGLDLRDRRRQLGLTQQQLSHRSGIGQPEISRIESGQTNLTVGTLGALAHALAVDIKLVPSGKPGAAPPSAGPEGSQDREDAAG
jgi:ribosome-binding protein aMBF1 (putative translation factor)